MFLSYTHREGGVLWQIFYLPPARFWELGAVKKNLPQNPASLCVLSKRSIPKRFYYLFDRLGANIPNYRAGIRWCNKCATIADNALSKEPDYIPPKVSVQMFILFLI